jgi:hypothetical protein
MINCAEALLRARLPKSDPMVDLACSAVDLARREDGPLRAEELADQLARISHEAAAHRGL